MGSDATALEEAIVEFFSADGIDEIDWATGDYEKHGRYLMAMYLLGMNKAEAYNWVNNEYT